MSVNGSRGEPASTAQVGRFRRYSALRGKFEIPRHSSDSISAIARLLGHRPVLGQPPPGRDLTGAGQRDGEQFGAGGVQPGVGGDGLGHRLHRLVGHPGDPLAHGRVVAEVGLEDQPERAVVAAGLAVDEVEVGRKHPVDALLVVVGLGQRRPTAARSASAWVSSRAR